MATVVDALLSYAGEYIGRSLRFNSALATGGIDTHGHSAATGRVNSYNAPNVNDRDSGSGSHYDTHDHAYNHGHGSDGHAYNWYGMRLMRATGDITNFEDLPSNCAGIFTSATMPTGWSNVSASVGRLLRSQATGASTGGNGTTHVIGSTSPNTSDQAFTEKHLVDKTGSGAWYIVVHEHTIIHGHGTGVSNLPPYIRLYVGKKD
jgi:hypothetical protein